MQRRVKGLMKFFNLRNFKIMSKSYKKVLQGRLSKQPRTSFPSLGALEMVGEKNINN